MSENSKKFSVFIPGHDYYENEVECRTGCPVKTDARGYLIAAAEKRYREAYAISRKTNPFASICGKICGAPCETACRRGDVDDSISIRNVKGFLTEKYGPESGDLATPLTYSTARGSVNPAANGKKVAIIGGGCAGYTCAHDLARLGYSITVFEKYNISGGILVQGVPTNRLSREVVQAEIDSILHLGNVEVKHNVEVGKNISFNKIKKLYDAVFISVGLMAGTILPVVGSNHKNVHTGLEFLFDFNSGKYWDFKGKKIAVIGGGDVAMDVARASLRCKAKDVGIYCVERESLGEMRGSVDERLGARREGVLINDGWGPSEIIIENRKLKGLKIKSVLSLFDENGNFAPAYDDESVRFMKADVILMAVGQKSVLNFLKGSKVKISQRGIIEADPITKATSVPGVFAGGDVALGPKLFIDAVEDGSLAALGIDSYLSKKSRHKKIRKLKFTEIENYGRTADYLKLERIERTELEFDIVKEPERNSTIEYNDVDLVEQSSRCLECQIHPTFEGNVCILCGACVDTCPSYCLRMVELSKIEMTKDVMKLIAKEFPEDADLENNSVMLFDPLKCVRCGMCAQICPTGACKMSENSFVDTYIKSTK